MDAKNKKLLFGIGTVIVLAFLASYMGLIPLTLISESKNVYLGDDGKVYTVSTLSLKSSDLATYAMKQGNYDLKNGTTVNSSKEVIITAKPMVPRCNYNLKANPVSILGYNIYTYYNLLEPSREQQINITTSTSTKECIFDNFDTKSQCVVTDKVGTGFANISAQGNFIGKTDCLWGDFIVLNNNGAPKVVNKVDYALLLADKLGKCGSNILNCKSSLDAIATGMELPGISAFSTAYSTIKFSDPTGTEVKTKMYAIPTSGNLGTPVITIIADEAFFDSVRYTTEAPAVHPVIIGLTSGDAVESAQRTFVLTVKNPSSVSKTFSGSVSTKLGSVSPKTFDIKDIPANSQGQITFTYNAPSVSSDTANTFTISVCDYAATGQVCTDYSKTFQIVDVPPTPIPVPSPVPYCGDTKCSPEIGENYVTCPKDCKTPTPTPVDCSETPNSYLSNGECICKSGFERTFDQTTGAMVCGEPSQIPDWAFYAVGVVAIGAVAYAVLGGKKGGRRK